MIVSEKLIEGSPADLPAISGLSPAAAAIPARLIWDRIEGYTGQRFGTRSAEWLVSGSGYWQPKVEPWHVDVVARWDGGRELWEADELPYHSDVGYSLTAYGVARYRFVGEVGTQTVPGEPFTTAYRRFAEFFAGQPDQLAQAFASGVSSVSVTDGQVSTTIRRDPKWMASAWQASGAADALRYHRRPR